MGNHEKQQHISVKTLALISEFALVLYRHNGTLIDIQADNVLAQISESARCTNDAKIRSVFIRIRAEMRTSLKGRTASNDPHSSRNTINQKPERRAIEIGLL